MKLQDRVEGWMTGSPETVSPHSSVLEAFAVMCEQGIRHLPVVSDGRLVGIVSDRDMTRRGPLGGGASAGRVARLLGTRVSEIMTRDDLQTATPAMSLREAARIMADTHTSSLPVLEDGELVGIITSQDLLRALSGMERFDENAAAG